MVGFEPTTLKGIDLQSTALNHSATSPTNPVLSTGFEPISQRLWASRFAIKLREGPPFIIKDNFRMTGFEPVSIIPKTTMLPLHHTLEGSKTRTHTNELEIHYSANWTIPPYITAPDGTRTHNLSVKSRLLYQLSYRSSDTNAKILTL